MPETIYSSFLNSNIYLDFQKLSKKYGINYVDSNSQFIYADCMFRDQLHLKNNFLINYKKYLSNIIYD